MTPGSTAALPREDAPRVGRPRDPAVDAAIVDATLALLADGGYAAVTMEAVAARAGVGKATLYRRYSGKDELVVDAVATLVEPPVKDAAAPVRDQLVAVLEGVRRKRGSLSARIFPRLVSETSGNPALLERYREQVVEARHALLRSALARAVDEGLVRPDVDLDHAVDLLVGPIVYRNLVRPEPPAGPDLAPRVVDDVLRALAPVPPAQETS
jgi:AcrR family transcriptional regulator